MSQVSYEEKLRVISQHGWQEYYPNNCIRTEWIEQRLPYDRMVCSVDRIYNAIMKEQDNT